MKLAVEAQQTLLELANLERARAAAGSAPRATEEQQALSAAEAARDRARSAAAAAQLAVDDMEAEILRIQEDERNLRARERDDKKQLAGDLDKERRRDLEHDRYAAKSRIADLMGELMECHNEVAALRNNRDRARADLDSAEARVEQARTAAADAPAAEDPAAAATELKAKLDPQVLAAFEKRREENEVGVARFNGRSCSGCYMVLPAADRSRIAAAPAAELPECPNCGSYLVRENA